MLNIIPRLLHTRRKPPPDHVVKVIRPVSVNVSVDLGDTNDTSVKYKLYGYRCCKSHVCNRASVMGFAQVCESVCEHTCVDVAKVMLVSFHVWSVL